MASLDMHEVRNETQPLAGLVRCQLAAFLYLFICSRTDSTMALSPPSPKRRIVLPPRGDVNIDSLRGTESGKGRGTIGSCRLSETSKMSKKMCSLVAVNMREKTIHVRFRSGGQMADSRMHWKYLSSVREVEDVKDDLLVCWGEHEGEHNMYGCGVAV